MKTIYKYELPICGSKMLTRTYITRILAVGSQNNIPVMWCEVNPDKAAADVIINVVQTGLTIDHPVNTRLDYVGTFMLNEGEYVGHVYAGIMRRRT